MRESEQVGESGRGSGREWESERVRGESEWESGRV